MISLALTSMFVAPTMSTMESTAPTSWKATFSTGTPWESASASARSFRAVSYSFDFLATATARPAEAISTTSPMTTERCRSSWWARHARSYAMMIEYNDNPEVTRAPRDKFLAGGYGEVLSDG